MVVHRTSTPSQKGHPVSVQDLPTAEQGRVTARPEAGPLYAHDGMLRARHLEGQTELAWCLTLVTKAVVTWTTKYYGLAVEQMRTAGRRIDDEVLAHISPAHSENINFFGALQVDIEGELAQLDPTGYRSLRVRDTLF